MTSKQRAYLKSLAMKIDPIYNIGKGSISPELVQGVRDALEARELIKIGVLQNCMDDPKELANVLAERTRSQVVQVIRKKSLDWMRFWLCQQRIRHIKRSVAVSVRKTESI